MKVVIDVPDGVSLRGEHLLLEAFEKGASGHCVWQERDPDTGVSVTRHHRLGITITVEP